MKTLNEIRETFLQENDHLTVKDLIDSFCADEMMDIWLEENQAVKFTNSDDFQNAVEMSMYFLKKDEACTYFNGEDYPLKVEAYRWNIEQAIINRTGGTMHSAAIEYVENLARNLP